MSPGRAPDRSTGVPPSRVPSIATLTDISRPAAEVAPGHGAVRGAQAPDSGGQAVGKSSTQVTGVSGGMVRLTTMDVARAPMALMSLRFWAAAFQPTS